jgi:L-ascorbate metabolism protein UlaG (beta-lactamase superfamily)
MPSTPRPDRHDPEDPGVSFLFIGTATAILEYRGLRLLTDPNFLHRGQFAYLGKGLVSRRLTEPAVRLEDLPELDAVVLSHLHGDHWDRVAQRGLDPELPVVTTVDAARRLHRKGFHRALGLRVWQSHLITRGLTAVRVTAMPGRHAPIGLHRLLPPVMGTMLEFGRIVDAATPELDVRVRMYLSGDTLLIDELAGIPRRYPEIDAAVVHLGGTRLPGGILVTLDGVGGADLVELIDPATAVPVHFDDYARFSSPLSDFVDEMERRGLLDRLTVAPRGRPVVLRPGRRRPVD